MNSDRLQSNKNTACYATKSPRAQSAASFSPVRGQHTRREPRKTCKMSKHGIKELWCVSSGEGGGVNKASTYLKKKFLGQGWIDIEILRSLCLRMLYTRSHRPGHGPPQALHNFGIEILGYCVCLQGARSPGGESADIFGCERWGQAQYRAQTMPRSTGLLQTPHRRGSAAFGSAPSD